MKIFIADDSAIVRERLITMFSEMEGIEVIGTAQRGNEAIECIQELKPDVVILDIRMPGGNGIDVLQSIKKENPDLMVIMLTNYPYPQYRKKCMKAGADYFFDKATEFKEVPKILKMMILDSHRKDCM